MTTNKRFPHFVRLPYSLMEFIKYSQASIEQDIESKNQTEVWYLD